MRCVQFCTHLTIPNRSPLPPARPVPFTEGIPGEPLVPSRPATYRPLGHRPRVDARPTARQRGYDWRWQEYARQFLKEHPLCARCEAAGRTTAAAVVDHITPHRGNAALFDDAANHQPLCKRCHDRKTATEDRQTSG